MDFETAKAMYDLYLEQEKAILTSQKYTLADGTSLERVHLPDIRKNMRYWEKKMNALDPTNPKKNKIRTKTVSFNYVD